MVVESKSPERAAEVAAQLANLGFQAVPDEDGANIGTLTLSHPHGWLFLVAGVFSCKQPTGMHASMFPDHRFLIADFFL